MKIRNIIICGMLMLAQTVWAQTAMEVLDNAAARVKTPGGMSANFTATSFKGSTENESITGTMSIMGQKYVLKTPQVCTWYNGTQQWSVMEGNDEVSLTKPTAEELQHSSPTAFLGIYRSGYNLSLKKVKLRGQEVWEVTMKAKTKNKRPSVIIADIDKTYTPLCIRLKDKGNWTRITIRDIKSGRFADKDFDFPTKDYPNHTIYDMQ